MFNVLNADRLPRYVLFKNKNRFFFFFVYLIIYQYYSAVLADENIVKVTADVITMFVTLTRYFFPKPYRITF